MHCLLDFNIVGNAAPSRKSALTDFTRPRKATKNRLFSPLFECHKSATETEKDGF